MMKLSIIIPTYNVEQYVEECLTSVIPQLTSECELIIVDDASTDTTVAKVAILTKRSKATIIFWPLKENGGVSVARNKGLELARGEYIAFIDGDDKVSPRYILTILLALNTKKDFYYVGWRAINSGYEYKSQSLPPWNCSVWSRIFKRKVITQPFRVGVHWGEDWYFLQDNLNLKNTHGYVRDILYLYRDNREGGLTATHT
jgi:glycosyltransferase involved in cell wall biosynthesis